MSQYLGDISAYALAVSQGYTGTEEEYAELMASYATVGQTAVTAAQTATTKASEAATSATTATNKASEATTAATTATTKAGEASTSASTATSAKDTAVSASQTATSKATEATTAAATAVSAKDDAVSANTSAQSAKTAAQTAQTGAETAAASVQSSAAQIATNAEDISQLKSDLEDVYWKRTVVASNAPNAYNVPDSPVIIGDTFKISNNSSGTVEVRLVDENNTQLSVFTVSANTTLIRTSQVNADHIRCYFYQNGTITLVNVDKIVPVLQEDVAYVKESIKVDMENILNPISGSYIPLNNATTDIDNPIQTNAFSSQVVKVNVGDVFYITGLGGNVPRLYGWVESDKSTVHSADYQGTTRSNYRIEAPINGYLVFNYENSNQHALYKDSAIAEDMIYRDNKIQSDIVLDTITDITDANPNDSGVDLSGTYADITNIQQFSGFSLQIIEAKQGQIYYITGRGGNKTRVYGCVSKTGYIFKRAIQDATLTEYELLITEDCYLVLHFHRGYPMSVKVKDIVNESIPRIKDDITKISSKQIRYLYPFGHGISGKLDVPDMPALTDISQNEPGKLTYFYGLYDNLVLDYPTYVSKVDCDAEVQAKGISRPEYMNDYPIYMYKFIPPFTRGSDTAGTPSAQDIIKVFITTGTHPEYISIFDCYQTMKLICSEWENDENLEALRWNVEFYVMPCSGSWGVENFSRPNYNGVDLNRNAGTKDWTYGGYGTIEYSGPTPNSEYETKVFNYYLDKINPLFYIDHHNFTWSADLWYGSSRQQKGVDMMALHISDMTRRVKKKYSSVFPPLSDNVIFGFSQRTVPSGTRGTMAAENGALSTIFETCESIGYSNGVLQEVPVESWSSRVVTIATNSFINYILRLLMTWV